MIMYQVSFNKANLYLKVTVEKIFQKITQLNLQIKKLLIQKNMTKQKSSLKKAKH